MLLFFCYSSIFYSMQIVIRYAGDDVDVVLINKEPISYLTLSNKPLPLPVVLSGPRIVLSVSQATG
jgi:hypothetical protein